MTLRRGPHLKYLQGGGVTSTRENTPGNSPQGLRLSTPTHDRITFRKGKVEPDPCLTNS